MRSVKKVERISVDDYLRLEERGEERHEYVHGAIYAMVGGIAVATVAAASAPNAQNARPVKKPRFAPRRLKRTAAKSVACSGA